jgi:UDP-3-O-[3-hydroxymyristoyl] glucosamine N-acyltransferase
MRRLRPLRFRDGASDVCFEVAFMPTLTLGEIATMLNCPPPAGADRPITGVAMLAEAGPGEISFLGSDAYLKQFQATQAAAVLVSRKVHVPPESGKTVLTVDNADLAVAQILARYAPPVARPGKGVDSSAKVDASAKLAAGVAIGPLTFIGARATIGRNTVIHPGVVISDDVTIGDDCEIFPNVTIRERITLGNRVIINAGTVIGTDGFGYRWDGTKHAKIPQIGTVIIEDDVEIGSGVCIDRAKFSATRIGMGTKIDNLVQIAHNVVIGPHCIIVGQVGLAGSSRLGAGVVLGGQVAVRDHVTLGDGVTAGACSAIADDVKPRQMVSGVPAVPHRQNLRQMSAMKHLPTLLEQVRTLQSEIESLKKQMAAKSG